MRLAQYLRMSTDKQEDSPETQRAMIAEWCNRNGHEIVAEYFDGAISGRYGADRRPALAQMISDVAKKNRPFQGIVVYKLDRFARNSKKEYPILEILDLHHCELFSATEHIDRKTSSGRFSHHVMMGVRTLEAELAGERVYAHNLSLALKGQWPAGKPPLGFDYNPETKQLSVSDRADEVITVFQTWIENQGNSSRTARILNRMGMLSRDGNPWRDDSVAAIVKNPIYRQRIQFDGRIVDAPESVPAIVPVGLLEQADALLPKLMTLRTKQRAFTHAYSGILRCSICGSRMKATGNRDNPGWVCSAKKDSGLCDSRSIADKYIDRLVGKAVSQFIASWRRELLTEIDETPISPQSRPRSGVSRQKLLDRRNRTIEAYISGVWANHPDGGIAERDRRLMQIDAELASLKPTASTPRKPDIRAFADLLDGMEGNWPQVSQEAKRKLLQSLSAVITVRTERHKRLWVELETPWGTEKAKVTW